MESQSQEDSQISTSTLLSTYSQNQSKKPVSRAPTLQGQPRPYLIFPNEEEKFDAYTYNNDDDDDDDKATDIWDEEGNELIDDGSTGTEKEIIYMSEINDEKKGEEENKNENKCMGTKMEININEINGSKDLFFDASATAGKSVTSRWIWIR